MCFHVVESNRPRGWRRNEITGAGVRASSRLAIFQNCQGKLSASEDITGGGRARRTKKPSRQPKFLVSCAQMDQVVGLVFTRMQSAVWMEQSRFVDGVKTPRPAPPPHTHRYFHIQTATLHRPLRFPFVGRKGRALMQMGQSNHSLDVPRAVEYAMPSPSLLPPLYISCRVANGMYVPHLILYFFLLPMVLHSPTSSQQSKKLFTDGHGQRKRCART